VGFHKVDFVYIIYYVSHQWICFYSKRFTYQHNDYTITYIFTYIRRKESTKQKKIKIIITTILRRERTDWKWKLSGKKRI
jgi:hypothetical protein